MQAAKELQPVHPLIVEAVTLFNRMEEIQQEVARQAYDLFEQRGREHGHDVEDWAAAESQLLAPISIQEIENADGLEITARVPGFNEHDIEIAVEPRRVFLSGKSEKTTEATDEDAPATLRQTAMFFRAIDLPVEVDAAKATAQLTDGTLRLSLPKLAATGADETAPENPAE
jgi:HSP20 family molecular chaperone IbpA